MNQIAETMREGLLALAVGAGLQVMAQLMEADVSAVCGPRGRHRPGPDSDPTRHRGRVGHPGRMPGPGDSATGPGHGRHRRGAGAGLRPVQRD